MPKAGERCGCAGPSVLLVYAGESIISNKRRICYGAFYGRPILPRHHPRPRMKGTSGAMSAWMTFPTIGGSLGRQNESTKSDVAGLNFLVLFFEVEHRRSG